MRKNFAKFANPIERAGAAMRESTESRSHEYCTYMYRMAIYLWCPGGRGPEIHTKSPLTQHAAVLGRDSSSWSIRPSGQAHHLR